MNQFELSISNKALQAYITFHHIRTQFQLISPPIFFDTEKHKLIKFNKEIIYKRIINIEKSLNKNADINVQGILNHKDNRRKMYHF